MRAACCMAVLEGYNWFTVKMRSMWITVVILACAISLPLHASAHTTGASWNATSGPYTVDVGYDPVTFTAGQYTRFDFLLWNGPANTSDQKDFSQIWVRIVRDDNHTLLATGIWKQPVGPTTLLFEFAEAGSYTLEVSYRDRDGNDIAVAKFPITVSGGSGSSSLMSLLIGVFAFIVGVGLTVIFLPKRRA